MRWFPHPRGESLQSVSAALEAGRVDAARLLEQACQRARAAQARYNAWAFIAEGATASCQEGTRRSSLDGIPISVKDTQHVAGMPTRFGSAAAAAVHAVESSPMVARLQALGVAVVGKTTTPEFAWKATTESPLTGVTRNPRYPELSPGGSSGGAAVSVAEGSCLLATGTDAGGSVRIPAAFTATVGFKPSHALAGSTTAVDGFRQLGHWGLHGATVADLRFAWAALQSCEDLPATATWACLPDDAMQLDETVGRFYREARQSLARLWGAGATAPSPDWSRARVAQHTLYKLGCRNTVDQIPSAARHLVDPGLLSYAQQGDEVDSARRAAAEDIRIGLRRFIDELLERVDVLVLPTVACTPPPVGQAFAPNGPYAEWLDWAHCTYLTNLTGHPSLSLPAEFDGLPCALQLIARTGADARLLAIGETIERGLRP